jgi:stalled ribosome rescue protein Dom34
MIHQIVYAQTSETLRLGGMYGSGKDVNVWEAIKKALEGTGDHIVWIVTTEQKAAFLAMVKKYKLDKYFVVDHSEEGKGTTNRNYMDKPLRLKVFIMKGAK